MNRLRDNVISHLAGTSEIKNPLREIGLTKDILELGLNEDELYLFCLRRARDLLAIFHEDVKIKTPKSEELQAKYSSAFTALKDRNSFGQFLREFSQERTELRRDEVFLRAALKSEKFISQSLRTDNVKLTDERNLMKNIQNNFGFYLRGIASSLSFKSTQCWTDVASLYSEGEVAILEYVMKKGNNLKQNIPPDLESRFYNGCKILKSLDILGSQYVPKVEIYKISKGNIYYRNEEIKKILGCVDPNVKGLISIDRHLGLYKGTPYFSEAVLLEQIKPFVFSPSFLVLAMGKKPYKIVGLNQKDAEKEISFKLTRPRVSLHEKNSEVQLFPSYFLLGFRQVNKTVV